MTHERFGLALQVPEVLRPLFLPSVRAGVDEHREDRLRHRMTSLRVADHLGISAFQVVDRLGILLGLLVQGAAVGEQYSEQRVIAGIALLAQGERLVEVGGCEGEVLVTCLPKPVPESI